MPSNSHKQQIIQLHQIVKETQLYINENFEFDVSDELLHNYNETGVSSLDLNKSTEKHEDAVLSLLNDLSNIMGDKRSPLRGPPLSEWEDSDGYSGPITPSGDSQEVTLTDIQNSVSNEAGTDGGETSHPPRAEATRPYDEETKAEPPIENETVPTEEIALTDMDIGVNIDDTTDKLDPEEKVIGGQPDPEDTQEVVESESLFGSWRDTVETETEPKTDSTETQSPDERKMQMATSIDSSKTLLISDDETGTVLDLPMTDTQTEPSVTESEQQ